ncbi:MAG: Na/Pi cotransporter family protein, partial [Rhodocyclaceae bacterium]|nr:Na/Pi cotransporter family protein [Rhodocyclaceae bacterium]
YETATELAVEASAAMGEIADGESSPEATAFTDTALALLARSDPAGTVASTDLEAAAGDMESAYQALKADLLAAGAQGRLPVNAMDARLRAASALRRALEQAVKATRLLALGTGEASASSPQQEAS